MPKNYMFAPGRSYHPDSALNAIIETAVQLVMRDGMDAAERYLQAQGVSRYPPIAPADADSLCHRPCQAGPR